jgi:hypothetical protein
VPLRPVVPGEHHILTWPSRLLLGLLAFKEKRKPVYQGH